MNLPQSMIGENVQKLFKVLGGAGHVRFVGGCVRNMILGLPVGDIDLATTHNPDQVIKILSASKIKYVPTGLDHGTITAVMGGVGYEITTLRQDVAADGRRAVVKFTDNWAEDAARRDFTMNALYADLDGKIYDPLGQGLNDLKRHKVKFVGDAETRIQEDYLRILRFFRFQSLYGKGEPDKKALSACAKFAPKIKTLSRERITQEFTKILMADSPPKILKVMSEYKILPDILGKSFNSDRIGLFIKFQKTLGEIDKDVLFCLRLIITLDFQFKKITKISNILIINKKQISIFNDISKIKINTKRLDNLKMMELFYLYPSNSVLAALILQFIKDELFVADFRKLYNLFKVTKRPVLPISGKDLLLLGIPEGKKLGNTLKSLERKWIQSGFKLERRALINLVN
jgi:poly(A) polymerase